MNLGFTLDNTFGNKVISTSLSNISIFTETTKLFDINFHFSVHREIQHLKTTCRAPSMHTHAMHKKICLLLCLPGSLHISCRISQRRQKKPASKMRQARLACIAVVSGRNQSAAGAVTGGGTSTTSTVSIVAACMGAGSMRSSQPPHQAISISSTSSSAATPHQRLLCFWA